MTKKLADPKPGQEVAAVIQNPANSGADNNSSGYGGKYEGSSKRGETSDWYGETEQKDLPGDVKTEEAEHTFQKGSR